MMGLFTLHAAIIVAQNNDPGPLGAGALWSDTNAEILNRRNDANSAWVQISPAVDASIATHVSTKITGLPAQTQDLDMGNNDIRNVLFQVTASTELTIATAIINADRRVHTVDTESDDPTDTLTTINGEETGLDLQLASANSSRDTTVSDAGNKALAGDFTLDNVADKIMLVGRLGGTAWDEISRSDNV